MYDVIVIGGGICGCSLLYELSKYQVKALLLEKENDISVGTTKANSAIIHAGYDPEPGTKMAGYNVAGSRITREICARLDVPYRQIGSLVLAFSEQEMETVQILYERGKQNGVPGVQVLSREETLQMEPALSPEVCGALYAPTAAVVSPWELALAMAETAVKNGAQLECNRTVTGIRAEEGGFCVAAGGNEYRARFVVNAAGVACGEISRMAGAEEIEIHPSRGQYYLLDKSQGNLVSHVIFQCPTKAGKGVLVAPTVHGNLIVGPNAEPAKEGDLATTAEGMDYVRTMAAKSVPGINFRESIRNFAGLRAIAGTDDFIVGESQKQPGFFQIAGIKSPGLSSAVAIAPDIVRMMREKGLALEKKTAYDDTRKVIRFQKLSREEQAALVQREPQYGRVICRCETVTEGEIVAALHRPLPPCSVDGVKRRCGAGMGRCQGGFCGPRVQEIIARELGVPQEEIPLDRKGMQIITGETKTGGNGYDL